MRNICGEITGPIGAIIVSLALFGIAMGYKFGINEIFSPYRYY